MSAAPLTPAQWSLVADAAQLLEHGRAQDAAAAVAPLITAGCRHPDPLMIYAVASEQLGRFDDAIAACRAAVESSPERPDVCGTLGRMLQDQGRFAEAAAVIERAIALDQSAADNWHNLGLAANNLGQRERAESALLKATELRPDWGMAWGTLGFVQEQAGKLEAAEATLRRALMLDPGSVFARHTLTVTLRRLGKDDEALAFSALATAPETRLVRAHILADAGSELAPEAYRSLLAERPDLRDGHETYARLMPQIGRTKDALDTYRDGLKRAPSADLYLSALTSARDVGDSETLIEWATAARRLYGDKPEYSAFHGLALLQRGELEAAAAILESLASRGFGEVLGHCVDVCLRLGDVDRAERWAVEATEADFSDQAAWAYLTIIWRLKDDPREQWLADYERLVIPIALKPPVGFGGIEDFMHDVANELHTLHKTIEHPPEQSLRHGTQTRGQLFDRRSPLIGALAQAISDQVHEHLAVLPVDSAHPFLCRNAGHATFKGSWSVRLRSGGFHVGHIHHQGWLSSALYVELPAGMARAEPGSSSPGALVFGMPPEQFNFDLGPRRIEQPTVGRLVIFPSYFWHGTLPFDSDASRLTVAFDMVPQ